MFRRWYERRGADAAYVDRTFGHIDRFIEIMFRTADRRARHPGGDRPRPACSKSLCRVISLTEKRGYSQVEILLEHPLVMRTRR